jgi:hypothetical protein
VRRETKKARCRGASGCALLVAATAAAIAGLASAGCESFNDYQQDVNKLRILGVRADYPDVIVTLGAGNIPSFDPSIVHIDYTIGDPAGKGRDVDVYLSVCPPMAMDISVNFDCDGENGFPIPGGTLNIWSYLAWVVEHYPDVDPTQIIGSGSYDLSRGIPVLVWVRASAAEETVVSLKRITLRTGTERNHNPRLMGAMIENVPLTDGLFVRAGRVFKFSPQIDPATVETYTDPATGQLTTEQPMFVFYSSQGHFHNIYTDLNYPPTTWTSPVLNEGEGSREVEFWLEVLDLRGGIDWIHVGNITIVP